MATLQAPAPRSFPTVEQGTYTAIVDSTEVLDHTQTADQFGYRGHKIIFRWKIEGVTTEEGGPITLPQYVKLETGDKPYSKGARAGRLPWLTEITRAFGQPDLQAGDDVDPEEWVGKRAKLSVLEQVQTDGTYRNQINAVAPLAKKTTAPAQAPRVATRVQAPTLDEDPSAAVPF